MQRISRGMLAIGVVAASLVVVSPASAAKQKFISLNTEGSNKYDLTVSSSKKGTVFFTAFRKDGTASYTTDGKASGEEIDAKIKGIADVEVQFEPKGDQQVDPASEFESPGIKCTGKSKFREGKWVGKIEFKGEDGYTKVDERKAPGSVGTSTVECTGNGGGGGNGQPGVGMSISGTVGGDSVSFFGQKKNSGGNATFNATLSGGGKGYTVTRSATAKGPESSLTVDVENQTGTASPPNPFSGTAKLESGVLSGTLAVKFPGATVDLTGNSFSGSVFETQIVD